MAIDGSLDEPGRPGRDLPAAAFLARRRRLAVAAAIMAAGLAARLGSLFNYA